MARSVAKPTHLLALRSVKYTSSAPLGGFFHTRILSEPYEQYSVAPEVGTNVSRRFYTSYVA